MAQIDQQIHYFEFNCVYSLRAPHILIALNLSPSIWLLSNLPILCIILST